MSSRAPRSAVLSSAQERASLPRALRAVLACSLLALTCVLSLVSCRESARPSVVVYTALDRGFAEELFSRFESETGIEVLPVWDTESTKSLGLANRIRTERTRPRADVFWNNEILSTLRLAREGLLQESAPRHAAVYAASSATGGRLWHAFAARARVLIVNTDLVPAGEFPASVEDLADPRYRGRTGIAKPLFGTTASHLAALVATLGEPATAALLDRLKANEIQVHGGNKGCARAVAEGHAAFALTDTDDAIIELEAGRPVRIVYPDQVDGGPGTLFLPNTLALVAGAPHEESGRELLDWLLRPRVEELLSAGPSAQIPLHPEARSSGRARSPREVRPMQVDLERAAELFELARKLVEERFLE